MTDDDLLERRRPFVRQPLEWQRFCRADLDERQRVSTGRRERTDDALGRDRRAGGTVDDAVMGEGFGDRQVEERVALTEDDQPVAGLLDVGDDVRRQQSRVSRGADRLDQDVEELPPGERVEAGQRLVEEEDPRSRSERQRKPDLGLLAADSSPAVAVSGIERRST